SNAAPVGASFTMGAKGSFLGGVKQALGSMKIQKLATGMTLTTDFTGIGSQSALILVLRNGAQVASFHLNHNTPLSFTGGWARGDGGAAALRPRPALRARLFLRGLAHRCDRLDSGRERRREPNPRAGG